MNELSADYLGRAAAPGSLRYFALLYAEPTQRDALAALFVIDSEIDASVQAAHEVAHTRMQWWRAEIDRLINRNPQHPATRALYAARPNGDHSILHERMTAADMELARMTYNNADELRSYLSRSGGSLWRLFCGDADTQSADSLAANRMGAWIRRVETLRDVAADTRAGLIYWPLDELDTHGISPEQLRSKEITPPMRALLQTTAQGLLNEFDGFAKQPLSRTLRPLFVLASLHNALLRQIVAADYDVIARRHELGPFRKVWTAWRAARTETRTVK